MPYTPDGSKPYYLRLRISLLEGNGRRYKGIYRTVDALSTNTLEDLHDEIFDLFDRFDDHLWEFQIGGKHPYSKEARRFLSEETLKTEKELGFFRGKVLRADKTTLAHLKLVPHQHFFYIFDFGDEWIHKIGVSSYQEVKDPYPDEFVLVKSVGEAPSQYPDFEDEDEDEE